MPRYHFHLHNSVEAHDEEGIDLPDLDAAKACAVINARHLMSDEIKVLGCVCLSHSIEIADANGVSLHVTRYGDCIEIRP